MMKRAALVPVILLLAVSLYGYSLETGRIKLEIQENYGRFSLSIKNDATYTPLFVSEDTRTSSPAILLDDQVYNLAPGFTFSQTINQGASPEIIWEGALFSVKEVFTPIRSTNSFLENGVEIAVTITNNSEINQALAFRYLFDTYLGEDGDHFWSSQGAAVDNETSYSRYNIPAWCTSSEGRPEVDEPAMQFFFSQVAGATAPDRIVFANWKRLNDSSWDFTENETRNFNLLPYSINDSAVALYYNQIDLVPGASETIYIVVGQYTQEGFIAETSEEVTTVGTGPDQTSTALGIESSDPVVQAVVTDMQSVQTLIARIKEILQSGTTISDSDLQVLRSALNELLGKKENYLE